MFRLLSSHLQAPQHWIQDKMSFKMHCGIPTFIKCAKHLF